MSYASYFCRRKIDRSDRGSHCTNMTEKTIREMRDSAPFKAFDIHLSNGHALRVSTPDHLFFIPKSPEFLVVLPDGGFRIVDLSQVVSIGRTAARSKSSSR